MDNQVRDRLRIELERRRAEWRGPVPAPGEPGYGVYLRWANRTDEYADPGEPAGGK